MSSKECEEQLKELIYDWETEGLLTQIYATDIEAIKHLMLENQMQQDTIKTQKIVITNLSERIDKAMEYMKNNATSNYFDKEKNMFRREEDLLKILKGENNVENER